MRTKLALLLLVALAAGCEKRDANRDETGAADNDRTGTDTVITTDKIKDTTVIQADTSIDVDTVKETDHIKKEDH
jgi:hypothetical protein